MNECITPDLASSRVWPGKKSWLREVAGEAGSPCPSCNAGPSRCCRLSSGALCFSLSPRPTHSSKRDPLLAQTSVSARQEYPTAPLSSPAHLRDPCIRHQTPDPPHLSKAEGLLVLFVIKKRAAVQPNAQAQPAGVLCDSALPTHPESKPSLRPGALQSPPPTHPPQRLRLKSSKGPSNLTSKLFLP